MNKRCPVCLRTIRADGRGATLFTARGRAVVAVHDGACATAVRAGVQVAGRTLMGAAKTYLQRKAPAALKLLAEVAKSRRGAP